MVDADQFLTQLSRLSSPHSVNVHFVNDLLLVQVMTELFLEFSFLFIFLDRNLGKV